MKDIPVVFINTEAKLILRKLLKMSPDEINRCFTYEELCEIIEHLKEAQNPADSKGEHNV